MSGQYACSFLTAARTLEWRQLERPKPGPGEALVELKAVGVCGSDMHWYKDGFLGRMKLEKPMTLGHEPAGVVREVGEGVDKALVGKRVAIEPAMHCGVCPYCLEGDTHICPHVKFLGTTTAEGAFRELIVHPVAQLVPLPDNVSDEVGALLEPLAIGVHAVDLMHARIGETWLILGAGPIGLCSLLAARLTAPARVIIVEPLEYRRALAMELGADAAFHPEDPDLPAAAKRLTDGYGPRIVLEAAGEPESFRQMVELAAPGARVGVIGIDAHDRFGFAHSVGRNKELRITMVRRSRHTLDRALELTARGQWQPEALVTHRRKFAALGETMDLVADYRDGVIKAVVGP